MNMIKIIREIIDGVTESKKELDDLRLGVTYRIRRKQYNQNQLNFIDKLGGSECNTRLNGNR